MYYIRSGSEYVPTSIQAGDEIIVATYKKDPKFWVRRRGVGSLWMLKRDGGYTRMFYLAYVEARDPTLSVARQYGAWATGNGLRWEEILDRLGFRRYVQGRRRFRAKPLDSP